MQVIDKKAIAYIVFIAREFSKEYSLSFNKAFAYLANHGAIHFLDEHYDAEHLLSTDEVVEDMYAISHRNGGVLI